MKKKVLAVILAVVSVAALAACGSNGAAEPKATEKRTGIPPPLP